VNKIEEILCKVTGSSEVKASELIQELWSGYGELSRVFLDDSSVILKLINTNSGLDHPRGWNSSLSHRRKELSYLIERKWYQDYNSPIEKALLPRLIDAGEVDGSQYLILEDLKESGFHVKASLSWKEIKSSLSWLANFHAHHLGTDPRDLWPIGTYWHLDTRPEELNTLEDIKLKEAAPLIDKKLNQAKHKTLVHGDAKLANFLFNDDQAAAVDFQYVGGGVGVKDLAYFLSSIYREEELFDKEDECLDFYFKELNAGAAVEAEWRGLYPYAWCDFYRFLKGWSPGHYKLNSYSEQMTEKVLKWL
jgi:hypothetical protein